MNKTIDRYIELNKQGTEIDVKQFGCFFAFSDEQFAAGKASIELKDGEEIRAWGNGLYGTPEAYRRLGEAYKAIDAKIRAECDPQEVYDYEYVNFECCTSWDGDRDVILLVAAYFGAEAAKKIRRRSAYPSIVVDELFGKEV